jgi:hypothetical protein
VSAQAFGLVCGIVVWTVGSYGLALATIPTSVEHGVPIWRRSLRRAVGHAVSARYGDQQDVIADYRRGVWHRPIVNLSNSLALAGRADKAQ